MGALVTAAVLVCLWAFFFALTAIAWALLVPGQRRATRREAAAMAAIAAVLVVVSPMLFGGGPLLVPDWPFGH